MFEEMAKFFSNLTKMLNLEIPGNDRDKECTKILHNFKKLGYLCIKILHNRSRSSVNFKQKKHNEKQTKAHHNQIAENE